MATSLVRKGFAVAAFDTVPAHIAALVERGAARADNPASLVAAADVVITMLPDTPDVAGVINGPGGLLETGRAGMLMIDMSTIDPAASRSFGALLAKRDIRFMDAAVGRSPAHAERGESLFMVGAQPSDLERARPILDAMGNKIIHCGPPGSGISMKIVNNFLAMATCQISAEALTLGSKLGLATTTMYDVITTSLASNDHLKTYWPPRCSEATWTRVSPSILPTGSLDRGQRGGGGRVPVSPARRRGKLSVRRAPARGSAPATSPRSCSPRPRMPASSRQGCSDERPHPFTAPADSPSTT